MEFSPVEHISPRKSFSLVNNGNMILSMFAPCQQSLSHCIFFSEPGGLTETPVVLNGGRNMPDWFTHSLVGWITGKNTKHDIALVVIGALIPDLVKINLMFTWLGLNDHQFFEPLHAPIGAFLVAGIIAVFFKDMRKAFIPLIIGVSTHFILDFFLVHVYGGIKLLFPFSWERWQYYLIRSDDYMMTIVAVLAASLVYCAHYYYRRQKKSSPQ